MLRIRVRWRQASQSPTSPWTAGVIALLTGAGFAVVVSFAVGVVAAREVHYIYAGREDLPDLDAFMRFAFPTTGHIYDVNDELLVELADEYRDITTYDQIPPVVRDAILAAEDKRFFSHDGVDYLSLPRVAGKVRLHAIAKRLARARARTTRGPAIFPQGGSTVTQQLVRGVLLGHLTARENSHELTSDGVLRRALATAIGVRNVNKVLRKREELRLSFWLEQEMRTRFGSKRRAKQEILARYASFVYMGHGQHGFARAARHYFGQPLSTLTLDDADKAALLAGIPKAPRDYAPAADNTAALRRRNHVLALMSARGVLTPQQAAEARQRPLPPLVPHASPPLWSSAVVNHVLDELGAETGLAIDDLRQGQIQVYTTIDGRVQRIVSEALEHGLESYEKRHPRGKGLVQGAVVVLKNRDGSILAETGITGQIGIDAVLRTAYRLGIQTRLERYPTTSLGASEVNLLELATAYRAIASGVAARPFVVREVRNASGAAIPLPRRAAVPLPVDRLTLAQIQEGLRGVVRMPTGTAHALTARSFPIAVMGKTGTTNDYKDALFVGSTYGPEGITVAVRIGFDDGRPLGSRETGGRVALPVFREVMLRVYGDKIAGVAPSFPPAIEQRISHYLASPAPPALVAATAPLSVAAARTLTP
jgi:membrane peptidoglycan carboxypeptidase